MLSAQNTAIKTISSTISTLKGAESNLASGHKLTSAQQAAVGVVNKVMGSSDAKTISSVISGGEKMLGVLKSTTPAEYGGVNNRAYALTTPGKLTLYSSHFNSSARMQAETMAHESAHAGLHIPDLWMYGGLGKAFIPALGVSRLQQASEQFGTATMLQAPDAYAISLGLRRDDGFQ